MSPDPFFLREPEITVVFLFEEHLNKKKHTKFNFFSRENGRINEDNGDANGEENDDVICLSPSPPSKKETLKNGGKLGGQVAAK